MLSKLLKGQQAMMEKLDVIHADIRDIQRALGIISNQIVNLNDKLDKYHKKQMKELDEIQMSLYLNNQLLTDLSDENVRACNQYKKSIELFQDQFESELVYSDVQELVSYDPLFREYFTKCVKGIYGNVVNRDRVDSIFSSISN